MLKYVQEIWDIPGHELRIRMFDGYELNPILR